MQKKRNRNNVYLQSLELWRWSVYVKERKKKYSLVQNICLHFVCLLAFYVLRYKARESFKKITSPYFLLASLWKDISKTHGNSVTSFSRAWFVICAIYSNRLPTWSEYYGDDSIANSFGICFNGDVTHLLSDACDAMSAYEM